jgi:hypothetical protein
MKDEMLRPSEAALSTHLNEERLNRSQQPLQQDYATHLNTELRHLCKDRASQHYEATATQGVGGSGIL